MKKPFLLTAIVMMAVFPLSALAAQPDNSPPECKEWFAAADPTQGLSNGWVDPPPADATVLKAIDCLLLTRKQAAGTIQWSNALRGVANAARRYS